MLFIFTFFFLSQLIFSMPIIVSNHFSLCNQHTFNIPMNCSHQFDSMETAASGFILLNYFWIKLIELSFFEMEQCTKFNIINATKNFKMTEQHLFRARSLELRWLIFFHFISSFVAIVFKQKQNYKRIFEHLFAFQRIIINLSSFLS